MSDLSDKFKKPCFKKYITNTALKKYPEAKTIISLLN